jgi:alpha-L-fucosidase 2
VNFTTFDGVSPVPTLTCQDSTTLKWRGLAGGQTAALGMNFEMLAKVVTVPAGQAVCSATSDGAQITISNVSEATIVWVGNTDFSLDAGDAAHNFTFRGADPHNSLVNLINSATSSTTNLYQTLLNGHASDYQALSKFKLSLGQTFDATTSTDILVNNYTYNVGNSYLEWVLFNFGRYLLFSSARGTLPVSDLSVY